MRSTFVRCAQRALLGLAVIGLWGTPGYAQNSYDLGVLEDRMKVVERDVDGLRRAVTGAQAANTALRLDQLETELRRLTGKVEEMRFALDGMEREMKRFRRNTDDRLTVLEGGEPVARNPDEDNLAALPPDIAQVEAPDSAPSGRYKTAVTGTLGTVRKTSLPSAQEDQPASGGSGLTRAPAAVPDNSTPSPAGSEARAAYDAAIGLIRKRQYAEAGKAFERVVRRYPDDPLAANAQFWLGQSYYFQGQYEEAANAYLDGYRNHPNGSTAPDSLLKLGMTLQRLGQPDEACLTYQEVDSRYPGASATIKRRTASEKAKIGCR